MGVLFHFGCTAVRLTRRLNWGVKCFFPSRMDIYNRVTAQGDKIRELKAAKAEKEDILAAVEALKQLKIEYEKETGETYEKGKMPGEGKPVSDKPASGGDLVTPWDVQDRIKIQFFRILTFYISYGDIFLKFLIIRF